jgi:serine/threonine protein kinase
LPKVLDPTAENASSSPDLPNALGRYAVVRRIGRGGFADVYLGRDPDTGAFLALKVLRDAIDPQLCDQVRARFLAEEAIARAIDHPAIVRIRETSPRGARPCFIAMDYVDGLPFCEYFARLRSRPEGKRCPRGVYFAEVARLGHEIARAIATAHERGIVHRDLKPDNVLVSADANAPRVRILDFGIAKAPLELFSVDRSATVTRYYTELGTVMGSPPYMAPEQNGSAHAVTGKADVFALGVMLLVVLLGLDEHALELGEQRLVLPAEFDGLVIGSGLPERLRTLLRAMVDSEPESRPSMAEVALVLQRSAQSDELFGAAVEAWVRSGTIPSARELFEFSRQASDSARLTEDERAFLQRAPLERLRRARRRALWVVGTAGAVMAAIAATLTARPDLSARWLQAFSTLRARGPVSPALDPVIAAARPSVLEGEMRTLEASLSDQQRLLSEQGRQSEEQRAAIRALGAQLADAKRARELAERQVAQLEARVSNGARQLADCRGEGDRQGHALIECRRDVEAHLGQLAEGTERLRLCTKSLREQSERGRGRPRGRGSPETRSNEKPDEKSGEEPSLEGFPSESESRLQQ